MSKGKTADKTYRDTLAEEALVSLALRKRLERRKTSPYKLCEFLDSRDLVSTDSEASLKLSDLKEFLGLYYGGDTKKVAANIQDLDKMNANKLTELLTNSVNLFYREVKQLEAAEVYRSAIHALLLKTIEKTLQESIKSNLTLEDTVKKIENLITLVEPKDREAEDHNLLNDFADYKDPFGNSAQEVMFKFLYPKVKSGDPKPTGRLEERLKDPEIIKRMRACNEKLGVGKKDRENHLNRLLGKKKKLEREIQNIKDNDPAALEVIYKDNGIEEAKDTVKEDFLKDRDLTLRRQLTEVQNNIRAFHNTPSDETLEKKAEPAVTLVQKAIASNPVVVKPEDQSIELLKKAIDKKDKKLKDKTLKLESTKKLYKKQDEQLNENIKNQEAYIEALQSISTSYERFNTIATTKGMASEFHNKKDTERSALIAGHVKILQDNKDNFIKKDIDETTKEQINLAFATAIAELNKFRTCKTFDAANKIATQHLSSAITKNTATLTGEQATLTTQQRDKETKKQTYKKESKELTADIEKLKKEKKQLKAQLEQSSEFSSAQNAKEKAAKKLLSAQTWPDRIPEGFLSDADFDNYLKLIQQELNDPKNKRESQIKVLASTYDDKLKDSDFPDAQTIEWRQMYDVIIDRDSGQCILALPMCRGKPSEALGISKGNFGDVTFAFELFTGKCFALKKENTIFKEVNSKIGAAGSLFFDPQNQEERVQESVVTIEAGLSNFQVLENKKMSQQDLLDTMLKEHPYVRGHIEQLLKEKIIEPNEQGDIDYKECWTVQELLRSQEDFKDEIIKEINQDFIREFYALGPTAQAIKHPKEQEGVIEDRPKANPGNSELYEILDGIRNADPELKVNDEFKPVQEAVRKNLNIRFSKGLGYLEGLYNLHAKQIIHGDIKPKNFKGGEFFDFGTSWLQRQIEENEKKKKEEQNPDIGKMDSVKTGTVEFIPPEYIFEQCHKKFGKEASEDEDPERKLDAAGRVMVPVTYTADVYSAGVSLFNYTDLETYKKAFEWHNPPDKAGKVKQFPYTKEQMDDEKLFKYVDGRKYIKVYDDQNAEASGLELLEELSVLKEIDPKFKDLYDQLNTLFEGMCHWDPEQRIKTAEQALLQFVQIRGQYLTLLEDKGNTNLDQKLQQVQDKQQPIQKQVELMRQVPGMQKSLISAVVSEYYDYQHAKIKEAITSVGKDNVAECLSLFSDTLLSQDSPLLIAANENKTKIFKALWEEIKGEHISQLLDTKNIHRDLVYIAVKNNNFEMLQAIFEKLPPNDFQLKIDLILGNPVNNSRIFNDQEKGYNLLEWAAYHKNKDMLKFVNEQLIGSLAKAKEQSKEDNTTKYLLSSAKTSENGTLNINGTAESIFHSVAYSNDLSQFVELCNVFNPNQSTPYTKIEDIPLDVLLKLNNNEWIDEQGFTPFGLFFSKNEQFVNQVFAKATKPQDKAQLKDAITKKTGKAKMSAIQLAFNENNNAIIEKICRDATCEIFDLKDKVGNTPLHYLAKNGNDTAIEQIIEILKESGYESKKEAFIQAISQENTNKITPLSALILNSDENKIKNDESIFTRLFQLVYDKKIDEIGFAGSTENDHYKNKLLLEAIKHRKFLMIPFIISNSRNLEGKEEHVKAFFKQINPADASVGKNIFHYLFEEQPLKVEEFLSISSILKELVSSEPHIGYISTDMIRDTLAMFVAQEAESKASPLSLAIEKGCYDSIIELFDCPVNNLRVDQKKAWYDGVANALLSKNKDGISLLQYGFLQQGKDFLRVLLPVFDKMIETGNNESFGRVVEEVQNFISVHGSDPELQELRKLLQEEIINKSIQQEEKKLADFISQIEKLGMEITKTRAVLNDRDADADQQVPVLDGLSSDLTIMHSIADKLDDKNTIKISLLEKIATMQLELDHLKKLRLFSENEGEFRAIVTNKERLELGAIIRAHSEATKALAKAGLVVAVNTAGKGLAVVAAVLAAKAEGLSDEDIRGSAPFLEGVDLGGIVAGADNQQVAASIDAKLREQTDLKGLESQGRTDILEAQEEARKSFAKSQLVVAVNTAGEGSEVVAAVLAAKAEGLSDEEIRGSVPLLTGVDLGGIVAGEDNPQVAASIDVKLSAQRDLQGLESKSRAAIFAEQEEAEKTLAAAQVPPGETPTSKRWPKVALLFRTIKALKGNREKMTVLQHHLRQIKNELQQSTQPISLDLILEKLQQVSTIITNPENLPLGEQSKLELKEIVDIVLNSMAITYKEIEEKYKEINLDNIALAQEVNNLRRKAKSLNITLIFSDDIQKNPTDSNEYSQKTLEITNILNSKFIEFHSGELISDKLPEIESKFKEINQDNILLAKKKNHVKRKIKKNHKG